MSAGGLTFGVSKAILATVAENGIDANDPRVMTRTNEAIQAILNEVIPVGGMITADVQATGTELFLPKEFEAAYEVEVLGDTTTINNQSDVREGFFNIVNNFAYVDPSIAQDLPLVDLFLQPDPNDASILRRKYDFPGLTPNVTVRVTGPKRYIPITSDNDYLIVQNVLAIKDMIQAIWRGENNDPQGAEIKHKACIDRLEAEVKKHLLDPVNAMKRKGAYYADLDTYPVGTFGHMRARLALELPGGMGVGKSELTRVMEQAEMALIDAGQYVGTLQEYTSDLEGGELLAPREVETIVAIELCGRPLNIKNLFGRYATQGKWWGGGWCLDELRDEGEIYNASTGERRRQYRLAGVSHTITRPVRFVGALRWVKKVPTDPMVIKNHEAMRLMSLSMLGGPEAQQNRMMAIQELDKELNRFMAGQTIIPKTSFGWGFRHNSTRHRTGAII